MVIYGSLDPDPRVSGRGVAILQAQGIAVARGAFANEADWINLGHALRVTALRPFVQLKLALDASGRVPMGNGKPVWVTGEEARAQAHLLRAQADAILVGRNTIDKDDPALTCRLPGLEDRSPIRIAVSSRLCISAQARIFNDGGPPIWLVFGDGAGNPAHFERQGVRLLPIGENNRGILDPGAVLARLANEGITRLLVEGGPATARAFIDAGLADEIIIMHGSTRLSEESTLPAFGDQGIEWLDATPHFAKVEEREAGKDVIRVFRSRVHLRS
jgi:diaminohydroxyphosphoribosylaminopyrimidine deaminase/5-amino-6-(5-phosphoribosylamino)uracil reductase